MECNVELCSSYFYRTECVKFCLLYKNTADNDITEVSAVLILSGNTRNKSDDKTKFYGFQHTSPKQVYESDIVKRNQYFNFKIPLQFHDVNKNLLPVSQIKYPGLISYEYYIKIVLSRNDVVLNQILRIPITICGR